MKFLKNILKFIGVLFIYIFATSFFAPLFKNDLNSSNLFISNLSKITLSVIILTIFIIIYRDTIFKDIFKISKDDFSEGFKYWLIGLGIMIICNIVISSLGGTNTTNEDLNRKLIQDYMPYSIIMMSIYAPIIEELVFRKGIRTIINNKYLYIIISGLIFGSLHMVDELINPTNMINILYIIPYVVLGCMFALSYYKTNNIWTSIICHSLHNTIAIVLLVAV